MSPQEQMTKILELLQNGVNKQTFDSAFQLLVRSVQKTKGDMEARNEKINQEILKLFGELSAKIEAKNDSELEKSLKKLSALINKALKDQETGMNMLRDKLKDFKRTQDAQIDVLRDELRSEIPVIPPPPEIPKPFDALPLSSELEKLKNDLRVLGEELQTVKEHRRFGGGHTDIGIIYTLGRIGKTETPSGLINGSNTVYTVSQPIHFIFSFSINGQAIEDSQYTISGNTITFSSAIDASLSGTNFRIKYA